MRLNKAIKRIVALGTGLTTLGATFLGAMADSHDLSNYPSQFISDGVFDGVLVLGDGAAAKDVIGAVEIATSLQAASVTETQIATSGTTGSVQLTGTVYKFDSSADVLNIREKLNDTESVLTDGDFPLLADGVVNNEKGDFDYEQLFYPPEGSVQFVEDPDGDDDPHLFFVIPQSDQDGTLDGDNQEAYMYKLSFPTALKSDVDSSKEWEDLEDEKITILGKEYTVIKAENDTGTITLMAGAREATLEETEQATYTIGSGENQKTYVVKLDAVTEPSSGDSEAVFTINGERTDKIKDGDTEQLEDGTEIGIREIINVDGTEGSGRDQVTFFLGAQKVELIDSDWTTLGNSGGKLEVSDERINDVIVDLDGSYTGSEAQLRSINIGLELDEEVYVGVGGKMSEDDEFTGDEEDMNKLLFQAFDIEFHGLDQQNTEEIKFRSNGNQKYEIEAMTTSGDEVDVPLAFQNSSGAAVFFPGKDTDEILYLGARDFVPRNSFFFVTDDETSRNSHLLSVGSIDTDEISIKNEGSNEEEDYSVSSGTATLTLDGQTYTIPVNTALTPKSVNLSTGFSGGVGITNYFYTMYGAKIQINTTTHGAQDLLAYGGNATEGFVEVSIFEDPKNDRDDSSTAKNKIEINVTRNTDNEIGSLSVTTDDTVEFNVNGLQDLDSRDDITQAYTKFGTFVERDTGGDQDTLDILYGEVEAVGNVFLTAGETQLTTTSATGEGVVTTTEVNKIAVGAPKLASEVPDVSAVNAIVVGGPCANRAAADLTGVGNTVETGCLDGLTLGANDAIIKAYEDGTTGKVAVLVAGGNADATRRAARVLADYGNYALSGEEVSVTGTSMNDISVGPVVQSSGDSMEDDAMEETDGDSESGDEESGDGESEE